jgi:hypothetical protein
MCIGYIKIPREHEEFEKRTIKEIKHKHGIKSEVKWNTISRTKIEMYKELVDHFFASSMEFRCILVKYKDRLDNDSFNGGQHDNFYYKMVYHLLYNPYINLSSDQCRVYLDIKDSRGREKLSRIKDIFENKYGGKSPFPFFQHIRSGESQFIQLCDLIIGAVTYKARRSSGEMLNSAAKNELVSYIEAKSGYIIDEGTEPWEAKFNIFDHQPRKRDA